MPETPDNDGIDVQLRKVESLCGAVRLMVEDLRHRALMARISKESRRERSLRTFAAAAETAELWDGIDQLRDAWADAAQVVICELDRPLEERVQ